MAANVNLIVANPQTYLKLQHPLTPLTPHKPPTVVTELKPKKRDRSTERSIKRTQLKDGTVHYLDFVKKDPSNDGKG